MTAANYPAIQCDGPECYAETHAVQARTATEVRRLRREDGWHLRPGGRDLCPDCWKAATDEPARA